MLVDERIKCSFTDRNVVKGDISPERCPVDVYLVPVRGLNQEPGCDLQHSSTRILKRAIS